MKKFFKTHFSVPAAIFSLIFWTIFVAALEFTLFRALLGMTTHDVLVARCIGFPFNFLVGGFYQSIDHYLQRWMKMRLIKNFRQSLSKEKIDHLSIKSSQYGAIGIIKILVNMFIYSSKAFTGHPLVWGTVLLKASLVVLAGVIATKLYKRCYHWFLDVIGNPVTHHEGARRKKQKKHQTPPITELVGGKAFDYESFPSHDQKIIKKTLHFGEVIFLLQNYLYCIISCYSKKSQKIAGNSISSG